MLDTHLIQSEVDVMIKENKTFFKDFHDPILIPRQNRGIMVLIRKTCPATQQLHNQSKKLKIGLIGLKILFAVSKKNCWSDTTNYGVSMKILLAPQMVVSNLYPLTPQNVVPNS